MRVVSFITSDETIGILGLAVTTPNLARSAISLTLVAGTPVLEITSCTITVVLSSSYLSLVVPPEWGLSRFMLQLIQDQS